jgi:hypothetical protein
MRRLILAAIAAVALFAVPASGADAYMHAANCEGGLTLNLYPGNSPGDNEKAYEIWSFAHYTPKGNAVWAGFGAPWHPSGDGTRVDVDMKFDYYQYGLYLGRGSKLGWCHGNDSYFNDGMQ